MEIKSATHLPAPTRLIRRNFIPEVIIRQTDSTFHLSTPSPSNTDVSSQFKQFIFNLVDHFACRILLVESALSRELSIPPLKKRFPSCRLVHSPSFSVKDDGLFQPTIRFAIFAIANLAPASMPNTRIIIRHSKKS